LTLALEELGFPTLHTQHLYENEDIFQMWTDRIFQPSLENGKAALGTPDFDSITSHGYQATMDFPMALYVDQILERYPNCKFILTVRENSHVWFRSWDTLTKSITAPTHFGGYFITGVRQYSIYLRWLFAIVNQDDSFLTSSRPKMTQYKEAAIESYEAHNRRVREIVPPSQLLEYTIGGRDHHGGAGGASGGVDGWEPLCQFLDIAPTACPTHPFPKTNSARSVQVQAISAAATPLFLVLVIVFFFFTVIFQRLTGSPTVLGWIQYRWEQLVPRLVQKLVRLVVWVRRRHSRQSSTSTTTTTTTTTDKEQQEKEQQQQQLLQNDPHQQHHLATKKTMKKKLLLSSSYPKPKAL
jgi:hypothetical protein